MKELITVIIVSLNGCYMKIMFSKSSGQKINNSVYCFIEWMSDEDSVFQIFCSDNS